MGSWILINRVWNLNMDFGILNLILMNAKLDFNAFHCVFFIFTVLNLRFNEKIMKTSQNGKSKARRSFPNGKFNPNGNGS